MIITVKQGDTLFSLSREYSIPVEKISADNGVVDDALVIGQSLIIDVPDRYYIPSQSTTVKDISNELSIPQREIFADNYFLLGNQSVPSGSDVVTAYKNPAQLDKIIGGYAYDFITESNLSQVINYLDYIMPFTYGFDKQGNLIKPYDSFILRKAKESGTGALMHISTLTENGNFDSNLPSAIFADDIVTERLISNIISEIEVKGYDGADVDFEYLPESERENYVRFTSLLADRLHEIGKILVIAVPPKTNDNQEGLLVEGIDYSGLAENADYLLIMAYEYGYRFGPPLAISPVNQVRGVLDYAVTRVENQKLLLGISNYGYDWTQPYVRGTSDAPSISTVEAIELAKSYNAQISFDEAAMAPYFFYTDMEGLLHEVWFEDARSFAAKIGLIEEYNLSGGFIWDLMRENPQGYVTINSYVKNL